MVGGERRMRLENTFEVPAQPEQAWELLMDVPRVLPCMPGTELLETVDERHWKARMTVKLGPMGFTFATDVRREDVDESARVATLSASAQELRGRGSGTATMRSSLESIQTGTRVTIATDLSMAGAVAQYGRGLVEAVSAQLVSSFAECLRTKLAEAPAPVGEPEPAPAPAEPVRGLRLVAAAIVHLVRRALRRSEPTRQRAQGGSD
jgi:carbon monoxide dehydrogenase subunit G